MRHALWGVLLALLFVGCASGPPPEPEPEDVPEIAPPPAVVERGDPRQRLEHHDPSNPPSGTPRRAPARESVPARGTDRPEMDDFIRRTVRPWLEIQRQPGMFTNPDHQGQTRTIDRWLGGSTLHTEYRTAAGGWEAHGYAIAYRGDTATPWMMGVMRAGQMQGAWLTFDDEGQPAVLACYRDSRLHGPVAYFRGGQVQHLGHHEDGERAETWRTWDAEGRLRRVATYGVLRDQYDREHRTQLEQVTYGEDGLLVLRERFQFSKRGGDALEFTDAGPRIWHYVNDQRHGWQTEYHADGHLLRQTWYERGEPTGGFVEYRPDGSRALQGTMRDGVRVGAWQQWEGERHFRWTYDEQGRRHGEWREYDLEGNWLTILNFVRGEQTGTGRARRPGRQLMPGGGDELLTVRAPINDAQRLHGSAEVFNPDGTLLARGEFSAGAMSGAWEILHANGKVHERGNLEAGRRSGEWETFNESGALVRRTAYVRGNPSGVYEEFDTEGRMVVHGRHRPAPSGSARDGTWRFFEDGMLVRRVEYLQDRVVEVYELERAPAEPAEDANPMLAYGVWVVKDPDGRVLRRVELRADAPDGVWEELHPDGRTAAMGQMRGSARVGEWTRYYPNGNKQEVCEYVNGELHGTLRRWNEVGELTVEGEYRNGRRTGVWREFYPDGKTLRIERNYSGDEVLDGPQREFDRNGELIKEETYVRGVRHGLYREWHEAGRIAVEGNYDNGTQVGEWVYYWFNGNRRQERHYDDQGNPKGTWRYFRQDGRLERETRH